MQLTVAVLTRDKILCIITLVWDRLNAQLPSSLADVQRRNVSGKRRSLARTVILVLLCIVAISSLSVILYSNSTSRYFNLATCCTWANVHVASTGVSEDTLELNFAVVIDAGSSGSRVFIYHWPKHDGDPSHLLKIDQLFKKGAPVVKKVKPGLSTFADSPQDAYAHLKPLLDFAKDHIPTSKQEATLLYVLATAGMRLIPLNDQQIIMEYIQSRIKSEYNFYLPESSIEVISGKLEGNHTRVYLAYLCNVYILHSGGSKSFTTLTIHISHSIVLLLVTFCLTSVEGNFGSYSANHLTAYFKFLPNFLLSCMAILPNFTRLLNICITYICLAGVYSWITINYLLGKFDVNQHSLSEGKHSAFYLLCSHTAVQFCFIRWQSNHQHCWFH